jgi:hypothetical protein
MTVVSLEERYVEADGRLTFEGFKLFSDLGTGGGGSTAWGDLTGVPATFPPSAHNHPQSDVIDLVADLAAKQDAATLAATVQAYTLDTFADPVASVDFAQEQALQFVIENRTSDPGAPVTGEIWIRTDL